MQVFGKEPSFDPRTDPIVRVQARRLRARLVRYYREEGQQRRGDRSICPRAATRPVFRREESTASGKPSLSATLASRNTVAVCRSPIDSPEPTLDYFCRGLRDEIVHALTSLKALRVLATHRRRGRTSRPSTDAALLIGGSVREARRRAARDTQLVDGASGCYLWSESVDVALADPVAGQETIARADCDNACSRRSSSDNPRRAPADPATTSPRAISICRAATT